MEEWVGVFRFSVSGLRKVTKTLVLELRSSENAEKPRRGRVLVGTCGMCFKTTPKTIGNRVNSKNYTLVRKPRDNGWEHIPKIPKPRGYKNTGTGFRT